MVAQLLAACFPSSTALAEFLLAWLQASSGHHFKSEIGEREQTKNGRMPGHVHFYQSCLRRPCHCAGGPCCSTAATRCLYCASL